MKNQERFLTLITNVNSMISDGYNDNKIANTLNTTLELVRRQRAFLLSLRGVNNG